MLSLYSGSNAISPYGLEGEAMRQVQTWEVVNRGTGPSEVERRKKTSMLCLKDDK